MIVFLAEYFADGGYLVQGYPPLPLETPINEFDNLSREHRSLPKTRIKQLHFLGQLSHLKSPDVTFKDTRKFRPPCLSKLMDTMHVMYWDSQTTYEYLTQALSNVVSL